MPLWTKKDRLLTQNDFNRLRDKRAQTSGNRYFGLRWLPAKKRRLGIVVSKKVDKASKRNSIKRVIREFFRVNRKRFPKGDVLVIARPSLKGLTKGEIRNVLEKMVF